MRSLPQINGFLASRGKIPRFYFGVGKPRLCGMVRLAAITFLFVRRTMALTFPDFPAVSSESTICCDYTNRVNICYSERFILSVPGAPDPKWGNFFHECLCHGWHRSDRQLVDWPIKSAG